MDPIRTATPPWSRVSRIGLPFAVAAALGSRSALGEQAHTTSVASVVVSPPKCGDESFSLVAFLDSLRVELSASALPCCTLADRNADSTVARALNVRIDEVRPCGQEPDRVRIEVRQPEGARSTEREISLTDIAPAARPRALALAVAELIRSLGEEVREEPTKPAPRAPLPPPSRPKRFEQPHHAPWTYAPRIEGDFRLFSAKDTILWGSRAHLSIHRASVYAAVDVGGNFSNVQTNLGVLQIRSAGMGLGAGPRFELSWVALQVGPRAEIGWAWIRGATALSGVGTNSGSGVTASLGIRAALDVRVDRRIAPCVTLETGRVIRGMNGNVDGDTKAEIGGSYVLAALGLTISL